MWTDSRANAEGLFRLVIDIVMTCFVPQEDGSGSCPGHRTILDNVSGNNRSGRANAPTVEVVPARPSDGGREVACRPLGRRRLTRRSTFRNRGLSLPIALAA
jgi:hypothetical protein